MTTIYLFSVGSYFSRAIGMMNLNDELPSVLPSVYDMIYSISILTDCTEILNLLRERSFTSYVKE